ncbi:gluconate 2-dehydrogenase subunit 3 family protein [Acetobacter cibinongensis]|uniref:gluconate 2-dehydrogenase subunit 3 family protein n=1 Tax=Acetobacter cibinongensis TaxID=146475 RepID=UPI000A36AFE1|nr:gluconate 2-dehydrogenase subunit 3 family protein [Acetobacter cibinongensis]
MPDVPPKPVLPRSRTSSPLPTETAFAPTARRRHVVQGLGTGVAALAIGAGRAQAGQTASSPADASAQPVAAQNTLFFSAAEKAFLTAACERLFPEDASGPGATTLGVPHYIEQQMATPWARGETWYMQGPHVNGPANLGYQLPYTPQQLYRLGIAGTQAWVQTQHQTLFENLPPATQDAVLSALEHNITQFDGLPSSQFFEQLRSDTIEGAFADPRHGGNRHLAGWTMMGFPGARGDYMDWVDRYDTPYPYGPVSINGETP